MPITIKSPEEQQKMRVAGRLAADVLDMIGAHVVPGVTTDELDRLCHEFIVKEQKAIPANVGYRASRRPSAPRSTTWSATASRTTRSCAAGDIVNIDVTVIRDGFHGDTSRMYFVGKPGVLARAPGRVLAKPCGPGIEQVRPGARLGDIGHAIQTLAEGEGLLRGARILRPWHRPRLPRRPAGAALRRARHRHHCCARA